MLLRWSFPCLIQKLFHAFLFIFCKHQIWSPEHFYSNFWFISWRSLFFLFVIWELWDRGYSINWYPILLPRTLVKYQWPAVMIVISLSSCFHNQTWYNANVLENTVGTKHHRLMTSSLKKYGIQWTDSIVRSWKMMHFKTMRKVPAYSCTLNSYL